MRRVSIALWSVVGFTILNLGWTLFQRHAENRYISGVRSSRSTSPVEEDSSPSVKITQFYAASGEITEDDRVLVCYGVRNATSVRLDPPLERLTPALTRCFWVAPRQDTT